MNGLARFQQAFPIKNGPLDSTTANDQDSHLSQWSRCINAYKEHQTGPVPLLEHARINAFTGWEDEELGSTIELGNELDNLLAKFTEYEFELENYVDRLKPLEKGIDGFHDQLSHLAANFALLQEESTKLQTELEKLAKITNRLNPIVLDLMIPPEVVRLIASGPIDEAWVENIQFVTEKSNLIANVKAHKLPDKHLEQVYLNSVLFHQLEKHIDLLTYKIIERVRDYMISKIKQLRSPKSTVSSQRVQSDLLHIKDAFVFLQQRHPDLANNLQLAYIYTMRWYYHTRFAKYIHSLEKLRLYNIDSSNLLGSHSSEDKYSLLGGVASSGFSTWFGGGSTTTSSSRATTSPQHSPNPQQVLNLVSPTEYLNSIHKRIEILHHQETTPQLAMPSQIAETNTMPYWMEFVYHQWSVALESNIIVEYLFMVEFFYQGEEKFSSVDHLFPEGSSHTHHKGDWSSLMFEQVYAIGIEFVSYLLLQLLATVSQYGRLSTVSGRVNLLLLNPQGGTCDAYALLLMVRLVQKAQLALHNKFHIPTMDDYHNQVLMILWPHFTKIIDLHCDSMKKSILLSTDNKSLAPIALTQQFAQFLLGILKLCNAGDQDYKAEPIVISIGRLRNDFESILTKVSNNSFRTSKQVEKEIFLYNNYFLVVNILRNEFGAETSGIVEEQIDHFEKVCLAYKRK